MEVIQESEIGVLYRETLSYHIKKKLVEKFMFAVMASLFGLPGNNLFLTYSGVKTHPSLIITLTVCVQILSTHYP